MQESFTINCLKDEYLTSYDSFKLIKRKYKRLFIEVEKAKNDLDIFNIQQRRYHQVLAKAYEDKTPIAEEYTKHLGYNNIEEKENARKLLEKNVEKASRDLKEFVEKYCE